MPVHHVSKGLAKTDAIVARSECYTGDAIHYFAVFIPETFVRQNGDPFHWQVDACVASEYEGLGQVVKSILGRGQVLFSSHLPPEGCKIGFDFRDGLHMDVYPIEAATEITLPDGLVFSGKMTYPACKSRWKKPGLWIVDPVESFMEIN